MAYIAHGRDDATVVSIAEIDSIIANGYDIHQNTDRLFREQVLAGNTLSVEYLLKLGADATAFNNESICVASRFGYEEIVNLLIEHNADIHTTEFMGTDDQSVIAFGETDLPLRNACSGGHLKICQKLVSLGSDIHVVENWALANAVSNRFNDTVKYFLEAGASITSHEDGMPSETLLEMAVANADITMIQLLIDFGAVATNHTLYTYLYTQTNQKEILKMLLDNTDADFNEFFHLVIRFRNYDVASYVLQRGLIDPATCDMFEIPDEDAWVDLLKAHQIPHIMIPLEKFLFQIGY